MNKFDFWKENKMDQHFQLDQMELTMKFCDWLTTRSREWLDHYDSTTVIDCFITDKPGLNSVYESTQLEEIVKLLKPVKVRYLKETQLTIF
jgi:hypothetical protein